ncbi:gliding-motility protein MglA [bacterium]|nr:gliding-motility protein MglA [bacterium]
MQSRNTFVPETFCNIVYYGPAAAGKSTNLLYLHVYAQHRDCSAMRSVRTDTERMVSFDFIPAPPLLVDGSYIRFHLSTMPGAILYKDRWLNLLQDAHGVVFVADSVKDKLQECISKFHQLSEQLRELGHDPSDFPGVLQYNKRDLPAYRLTSISEMNQHINVFDWPWIESAFVWHKATVNREGSYGAEETFKAIQTQVVKLLKQ